MTSPGKQRLSCLCAALLFTFPCFAQTSDPYLATISIDSTMPAQTPLGVSVKFSLHVDDPDTTAAFLSDIAGMQVLDVAVDAVQVAATARPTTTAAIEDKFLRSSFVIDFDEEPVLALQEELLMEYGTSPTAEELVEFVYGHIDNKTYARSFDLASIVAANGEGDCTEHAVLLAALARANGHHARVIFGTVIMAADKGLSAYGHAWTEIHDGSEWEIMDATLPEGEPGTKGIRYLPTSILEDEGAGYSFGLFGLLNSMPTKITGVSNID